MRKMSLDKAQKGGVKASANKNQNISDEFCFEFGKRSFYESSSSEAGNTCGATFSDAYLWPFTHLQPSRFAWSVSSARGASELSRLGC